MKYFLFVALFFGMFGSVQAQSPNYNNPPDWLWMPTDTREQRVEREKARKAWAERKRVLTAIVEGDIRKRRVRQKDEVRHQNNLNFLRGNYRLYQPVIFNRVSYPRYGFYRPYPTIIRNGRISRY